MSDQTPGIPVKLSNGDTRHVSGVHTASHLLQQVGGVHSVHMWLRTDEGTLIAATHIVEIRGQQDD